MVVNKKLVSLIVPVYKKQDIIKHCIENQLKTLKKVTKDFDLDFEIIAVIDGHLDESEERLKEVESDKLRVISYKHNRGKGFAVRYGMMQAKGDFVGFIDAGLDIDTKVIEGMVKQIISHPDINIVVASKKHPASKLIYPFKRKMMTWGYSIGAKLITGISYEDTQVGAKMFTRELVDKVLPRLLVKRYAFDIELLAVSDSLGFNKHIDVPVEIDFTIDASSAVNFKQIYKMMWDTLAVGYRLRILKYYEDQNSKRWVDSLYDLLHQRIGN